LHGEKMTIGTTSRVVKVEYIHDGTTSGRDVYIEDYGRRWIKTNYTKETSPTGVLVGYIQSDGNIHMFDQTLNGAQTVHILICGSHPLKGTCQEKRVSLYKKEVNFLPSSHVG